MMMKAKLCILLALVFVISCVTAQTSKPVPARNPAEVVSDPARVPGELSPEGENIIIPANIIAGREFEVTVRTSGNGCVTQGDTGVILAEMSADIFVYDLTTATQPGAMCTMIFKQFDHKATLRFEKKGEATIRVWGRRSGKSPAGEPFIVEKKVVIK